MARQWMALLLLGAAYVGLHLARQPLLGRMCTKAPLRWLLATAISLCLVWPAVRFFVLYAAFYLLLLGFYALTDILHILLKKVDAPWAKLWRRWYYSNLLPFCMALLCALGSYWNARTIRLTEYEIPLAGIGGEGATVAFVSDMHVGTVIKAKDVSGVMAFVNGLHADAVILGGDLIDENSRWEDVTAIADGVRALRAPMGVYYILGNHEYGANWNGNISLREMREAMAAAGAVILVDGTATLANGLTIVGRDEPFAGGVARRPLEKLLEGVQAPMLFAAHRPEELEKGRALGVRLQISGHTHAGQIFPMNLIAKWAKQYEMLYGHRQQGDWHAIVSSGAGGWGLPIRIGTISEIVLLRLVPEESS